MIRIHYDFTDGTEVSYVEGKQLKDNFTTNCLDFFTYENEASDVIIICKNSDGLSRNILINNTGIYTDKQIRREHNIQKMLKSGTFIFKQLTKENK